MVLLRNVKQSQLYIGVSSYFYTFALLMGKNWFFFRV